MGTLIATFGGLLGLVLAMYGVANWMKKSMGPGSGTLPANALQIVGRRNIDRARALYVVDMGERYVLIGGTEGSLNLIDHITAEEFELMGEKAESTKLDSPGTKAAEKVTGAFGQMFDRARKFNDERAKQLATSVDDDGVINCELEDEKSAS